MQRTSKMRRTENGGRRRRHWGWGWYGGEWNKEKEKRKGGGDEVKGSIKGEEKK